MSSKTAMELAAQVITIAREKNVRVCTAESCTGGLIAACLTDIPGASAVVDGGLVTYSNEAKQGLLNVSAGTLASYGAVSEQTATEMATGALAAFEGRPALSVSVTGIAGPDGGTAEKPVGLVWFGIGWADGVRAEKRQFPATSREFIRERTVETALQLLLGALGRI